MSGINLEEIFKKAAAISKNVPENLREIAFNRALDTLLKENNSGGQKKGLKKIIKKDVESNSTKANIDYLLENIDRTKYQEIFNAPDVLTRALFLLSIVQKDFETDGLGPTDIAKILTEKFRIKSSRQAVTYALDAAGDKVDRVSLSGKKTYYRIMHHGEDFIKNKEYKLETKLTKKPAQTKTKKATPNKKAKTKKLLKRKTLEIDQKK